MSSIIELITLLQNLSPLAIIALLGTIIYMLVSGRAQVKAVKVNDLHNLPEMIDILRRIEVQLSSEFSWIHAKLNGR